jgi:2-polyprenyl-3-methyl-5-hydroxy-6-metoxy-1,4-benzoquinol methylase
MSQNYYNTFTYDISRFQSYIDEITELSALQPTRVLDIGVGSGFIEIYLKHNKIDVLGVDVDKQLNIDLAGSVTELPFKNQAFDVCLCCEVLEHLPYENFAKALKELKRVCSRYLILSLPDSSYYFSVSLRHTPRNTISRVLSFPILLHRKHVYDGAHYWEIGKTHYHLPRILGEIKNAGFEVLKVYRSTNNPYCRMFILSAISR